MDLQQSRYLDYPGLKRYCHLVAGIVGEVAARIFSQTGRPPPTPRTRWAWPSSSPTSSATSATTPGAEAHLPADRRAQAVRRQGARDPQPRLQRALHRAMKFQAERAHQAYDQALALLPAADARAEARPDDGQHHRTLLREIGRPTSRVLHQRILLTPVRKLWIAMKTSWRGR